jgi:hypothetical protein
MKIRREIYEEWLKRLRSGDYQKGVSYLRVGDKYCCWGVLCEIAVEADIVTKVLASNFDSGYQNGIYAYQEVNLYDGSGVNESVRAPLEVVGYWMGALGSPDETPGDRPFWRAVRDLTNLNDTGVSFMQIANVIESYLWELI